MCSTEIIDPKPQVIQNADTHESMTDDVGSSKVLESAACPENTNRQGVANIVLIEVSAGFMPASVAFAEIGSLASTYTCRVCRKIAKHHWKDAVDLGSVFDVSSEVLKTLVARHADAHIIVASSLHQGKSYTRLAKVRHSVYAQTAKIVRKLRKRHKNVSFVIETDVVHKRIKKVLHKALDAKPVKMDDTDFCLIPR